MVHGRTLENLAPADFATEFITIIRALAEPSHEKSSKLF